MIINYLCLKLFFLKLWKQALGSIMSNPRRIMIQTSLLRQVNWTSIKVNPNSSPKMFWVGYDL